jgi:hypothetical protein
MSWPRRWLEIERWQGPRNIEGPDSTQSATAGVIHQRTNGLRLNGGQPAQAGTSVALLPDMLKISQVGDGDPMAAAAILRLDGQVTGPWVAELRRVCGDVLRNIPDVNCHLVLDLAGLTFLDAQGVVLFRELAERRVLFTNGSAFIAEQLRGAIDGSE